MGGNNMIASHFLASAMPNEAIGYTKNRVRPRFFDQVGHKTMYASSGNKHFLLNLVIVRLTKIMKRAHKNWTQF